MGCVAEQAREKVRKDCPVSSDLLDVGRRETFPDGVVRHDVRQVAVVEVASRAVRFSGTSIAGILVRTFELVTSALELSLMDRRDNLKKFGRIGAAP